MNVAILIPTLGRADALAPLLQNIRETTPEGLYHVWFVVDQNDLPTHRKLFLIGPEVIPPASDFNAVINDGTYPVKTKAGYEAAERYAVRHWFDGDWAVLPTADDVVFHSGWYETARKHFEAGAMVVGTNDLTPATRGGRHATMPIVHRSYIDSPGAVWGEPGKVFHEGYHHSFVETELWQLAKHRGIAVFESESVIEHCHPAWGTREADETDAKGNQQGWAEDKALFNARKGQWLAS